MGEFNRALGIPHQVEALGQVWLVPELGPGVRGEYESWLEGNALSTARPARQEYERLEEMAAAAPRDPFLRRRAAAAKQEWRDTLEEARNAVTAQVYRWYGEVCLASLRTVGGAAYLLYLLLRQHHTDITPERCIDLWEVAGTEFATLVNAMVEEDRKNRHLPPLPGAGKNGASTTSAPSSSGSPSPASPTPASGG